MSDLDKMNDSFLKIKDTAYDQKFQKLKLSDLAELIIKKDKSPEEKKYISNIFIYIKNIRESITSLGQKILELNTDIDMGENILIQDRDNLELHTKDIIICLDQFIDSISALNRVYNFKESRIELSILEISIKSNRDSILKNVKEYRREKSLSIYDSISEINKNYTSFLNDIIDIVVKDAVKLSIIKLYNVLKKEVDLGDLNK